MNQTAANDNNNPPTLQSEQLRLALFLKKNNSMILMLIPVIAWLLWHDIAHLYILLWLSSMVLLVIIRHQLTPTHIDEMSASNIQKHNTYLWQNNVIQCCLCSAGIFFILADISLEKQVFLLLFFLLITMDSLGYVMDNPYTLMAQTTWLPILLWLSFQHETIYMAAFVTVIFFLFFLHVNINKQRMFFHQSMVIRLKNEHLTQQLQTVEDEKKSIQQTLLTKTNDAETSNRAKSDFLAMVSHEMRTPVHGLIGMLDLLKDVRMNKEARGDLKSARQAACSLRRLVNDVLDLSKAESGLIQLKNTHFHIEECIHDAMLPCLIMAKQQKTKVSVEFQHVPSIIHADAGKLKQILVNLISNAVKFTANGNVLIQVQARQATSAQASLQCLQFTVQDSGVGMTQEDLIRIFEPFLQLENRMHRQYDGTGLGAGIAKALVQQMGGELKVKSTLHQGSTFSFEIQCQTKGQHIQRVIKMTSSQPLIVQDVPPISPKMKPDNNINAATKPAIKPLTGVKVLVAEDDDISRRIALKRLTRAGFEVTVAEDGQVAWDIIQQQKFDLVLLDLRMPHLDGIQVATHIRQQENINQQTPIIGLSAHASDEVRQQCLDVGMNAFLMKPIEPDMITQKMQSVLDKR